MILFRFACKYAVVILALLVAGKSMALTAYDKQSIQQFIVNEAINQDVGPTLALAIAKVESDFNPKALSHAGAMGVMQIMPATAEKEFGISRHRLYDAQTNVRLGIRFIKQLLEVYDQRVEIALSHYNGGSAVRDKHGDLKVIPATQKYVNKVLATQLQFDSSDFVALQNNNLDEMEKPFSNTLINNLQQLRMHNVTRNDKVVRAAEVKRADKVVQADKVMLADKIVRAAEVKRADKVMLADKIMLADKTMQADIKTTVIDHKSYLSDAYKTVKLTKKQKVQEWESIFD